jgi:hypothetical protein
MFDFLWGAIMPLVCLAFDPFVFKSDESPLVEVGIVGLTPGSGFLAARFYPWSWPAYAAIGWQIACLGAFLVAGRMPAGISAVLTGVLWAGFAVASIVGVALIVPASLAAIIGIGFLGFTPLFTARAYYRRALLAGYRASRELPSGRAVNLALLGFVLAILVPGAAGLLAGAWIEAARWPR